MERRTSEAGGGGGGAEGDDPDRLIPGEDAQRRLPRGPHGIPADQVAQDQRERMVAAMAHVASDRGYLRTTVRAVTERAGVSTATFYRQFESLEHCMLMTFAELHQRLMTRALSAGEGQREQADRVRAALRRALRVLATDTVSARLLTVEILAVGEVGARSQHEAIGLTAEQLGIEARAGWGMVALACSLVAKKLIEGEAERIPRVEDDLGFVLGASWEPGCHPPTSGT